MKKFNDENWRLNDVENQQINGCFPSLFRYEE